MAITDVLLPWYDHEMGTTRKLLGRVPEADLAWKPHERSMSFGRLARHLVEIPTWTSTIINKPSYDLAREEGGQREPDSSTRPEILAAFDAAVAEARAVIKGTSDAELMAPWSLTRGGEEMFSLPRIAAVESFVIGHAIHHRGQLSVYLRLRDVPLPPIYGPSADESL